MDKALKHALEDIGLRYKVLIPVWILGTGADFGRLYPYARHLSFALLAKVFYLELLDDERRTREHLIQSTLQLAHEMAIECVYEEAEKVVDAMMVSEGSTKHTFSFQEQYYNEITKQWETYRFQFLELDRDASDLEESHLVYKLSEASQELFLNTNEIQKQLPISMQQLLVELLIEKGDLKSALRMLDGLNHRVLTLIKEEKVHKEELVRNPKETLYVHKQRWNRQLHEVEAQFEEESEKYRKLERILDKIASSHSHQSTYLELRRRIIKTWNNHEKLAKAAIENIRIEIEIRNTYFHELWISSTSSFRKTIWEETAKVSGFEHPDIVLDIVESIVIPHKPSILPLEWGLEHHTESNSASFGDKDEPTYILLGPVEIDWDSILSLWHPVLKELLSKGEVSLSYLQSIDEFTLVRWVENREALDLWMSFASSEEPFVVNEFNLSNKNEDKSLLIAKAIEKYPDIKGLLGKKINKKPSQDSVLLRKKVSATDYILTIEE
ncbi:hypothetical protein M4D71_23430 [Niallia taxi]|uniref:hypothetical protein n=1 Tax=Niallia taxi TaxID=2499688 RepID=UPI0021A3D00D|nr:hypothetical protein [Niallia taxi]MCT2347106.1 hypothetical protein [Niallia taxi]